MADTTLTALIGAGGAVFGATIGAAIPAILSSKRDRSMFSEVSHSRRDAFLGDWAGQGKDSYVQGDREFLEFRVEGRFEEKAKKLIGEIKLILPDPSNNSILILNGGFYDDYYAQFAYRSKNPIRKQMGVAVLRLSEVGSSLEGHYAGFSPLRGKFVVGEIKLEKVK